jgi:hypothetical protein
MAKQARVRYTIVLEPLPPPADGDEVPPIIRIRHMLKAALRCWRLRCTSIEEVPAPPAEGGDDHA